MSVSLGDLARDTISGFQGIVTSKHDYLNGCTRFGLAPQTLKDGKPIETCIFDQEQVELVEARPRPAPTPKGGPEREIPAAREI